MASVGRRTLIPLGVATVVFALMVPLTCTSSSNDSRQFCETFYRLQLPWSTIDGPAGTIAMYGVPFAAALGAFLLARSATRRAGEE